MLRLTGQRFPPIRYIVKARIFQRIMTSNSLWFSPVLQLGALLFTAVHFFKIWFRNGLRHSCGDLQGRLNKALRPPKFLDLLIAVAGSGTLL